MHVRAPDELGGGEVRWGDELDIKRLDREERRRVAGYLAKYSTKSTELAGGLGLLGFSAVQERIAAKPPADTQDIERAIAARNAARKSRDFKEADRIRDELLAKGIVLKDGPDGTIWEVHGLSIDQWVDAIFLGEESPGSS